jgi:hypothetical protein
MKVSELIEALQKMPQNLDVKQFDVDADSYELLEPQQVTLEEYEFRIEHPDYVQEFINNGWEALPPVNVGGNLVTLRKRLAEGFVGISI